MILDNEAIVYIKVNDMSYITAINSSIFLINETGWIKIDSGIGDKYYHAQGNYFDKPLVTESGAYQYKFVDGKPVECTPEEIASQLLPSIKQYKIAELSNMCNESINQGMEIQLSAEVKEYFTYSIDDQANISEMFNALILGAESYPYHASGAECRMYTPSEIVTMYSSLSGLKTHHLTYYNQLRAYVESLNDAKAIQAVTYGQELTGDYLAKYNQLVAQAQVEMAKVLANLQKA